MRTTTEKLTAPCSYQDIEKFQSWLEDLSAQGYLLSRRGYARHTYLFYRISPLKTRYRLTPVSDNLEDWNERPDTEKQTLSEAFGWEYVCTVGGFHIYRTYSDEVRELHSDPDVLAESLRLLKRRAIISSLSFPVSPLLYLLLIVILVGPNHIWRHLIQSGPALYASFALLYLFTTFKEIDRSIKLVKLRSLLAARKLPIHHQDWKTGAHRFRFSLAVTYFIGTLLILSISFLLVSAQNSLRYQGHPNDDNSLPFPSVLTLAEQSGGESAVRLDAGGMVTWSHPISPVNYQWTEIVDVLSSDGTTGRFSIELCYHEVGSDWLADRLSREYLKEAKASGTPQNVHVPIEADLIYLYTDNRGCPAAVLRKETTVIHVCFVRADFTNNINIYNWIIQTLISP